MTGRHLERGDEWCLDQDRLGRARVWYESAVVMVMGYGGRIGLGALEALRLLSWLEQHQAMLEEHASHWYDCSECGGIHPTSVVRCPLLAPGEGRPSSN